MENNHRTQQQEIQRRLLEIASEIFSDEENITITSTKEDVVGWDSLGTLNLLMTIEQEFDIEFSERELEDVNSIKDLSEIIVERT